MREEPDPAVLYPEVAQKGSLAAALQALAAGQGMSLTMDVTVSNPLRHATAPSVLSHREALRVSAWVFERRWRVCGFANNGIVVSGVTDDVNDVPAIVHAWAQGATLDEIDRAAGFDVLTGRFEVPDGNAADVIASEWQYMLKEARQADWAEYQALVEAAYAEPKLRELYPYTSHWALGFSETLHPFTPSVVTLVASRGGDYTIKEWWNGPALAVVSTAAEAISIAVGRLSKNPGPPTG